ncbi:MAG: DEAD/DEAH box helicase [Treponema sp.]|nr:DEAD/DEAH box helicase [Treponema sp.]
MEDSITFEDLGLDEQILAAVARKGFETPSPIQVLAIPRLLNGEANVIARARTGTGKTAAFGLPLIQRLRGESDHVRALILEPTRELAVQTCREMDSFSDNGKPTNCVVYGGASIMEQIRALKKGADIVTGTPGRVQDLIERKKLDLSKIEYFILDEGDEMLDMGFIDDIENIFANANPDSRILLFSATMPAPILKIAQKFMGEYEIVEEEGIVEEPLLIDQKYWVLREGDKIEALVRLIDSNPDFYGLVFTQTKNDADTVSRRLDEKGYEAAALHGDIPQGQREKILARFRSKKTRVLVATDVAARGIDITGLSHVVNYSLPFDSSTYIHRIGRTGRAGTSGVAVTFVSPNERRKLNFMKARVAKASKGDLTEGEVPSIDSVLEIKRAALFEDLKKSLDGAKESGASENFEQMAGDLCQDKDAKEVLASVLEVFYGEKLDRDRYDEIKKVAAEKGGREGRGRRDRYDDTPREDQTRLYIQLGRRDGYNAREIADWFSDTLHIPGKKVDRIDVTTSFSLVSLPKEDAARLMEMASRDNSIPHIHVDTKAGGSRGGRGGRRGGDFGEEREGRGGRGGYGRKREFGRDKDFKRGESDGFKKRGRPNPHTATERSGSSSSYFKSKKAKEF